MARPGHENSIHVFFALTHNASLLNLVIDNVRTPAHWQQQCRVRKANGALSADAVKSNSTSKLRPCQRQMPKRNLLWLLGRPLPLPSLVAACPISRRLSECRSRLPAGVGLRMGPAPALQMLPALLLAREGEDFSVVWHLVAEAAPRLRWHGPAPAFAPDHAGR